MNEIEKKYNKLSLQEKVAYDKLIEPQGFGLSWLIFPLQIIFGLAIFGLAVKYAFNVNILHSLKVIVVIVINLYWIFILAYFFESILYLLFINKKKRILLNIKKEVKNGRR
ncbi:MAG TPA: hypothetical protein ENI61_06300 [Ignavibacteria bacterium]|nr:hypothetical protein [Ignavibacteria bacterium]